MTMTNKRAKRSHYTRGGQILFHNLRMFLQVNAVLIRRACYGVIVLTALQCYVFMDKETLWRATHYWLTRL
ncbi:hypothetical protein [Shewanella sp. YLB-07]|uniref:hypothetical protein n=1 Tax=Shewanella sp. YLB-07 TaxID=2601268 RepID=UPI00188327B4|nr:hypothetical protein [Shewanella sp. YLB-07]